MKMKKFVLQEVWDNQGYLPSCLLTINLRLEIFGGFCITKLKKFESQKNKGFTYLALVSSKSRISVLLVFLLDCLPDYIQNYSEPNKGSSKAKQIKKVQLKIPKNISFSPPTNIHCIQSNLD